MPTTPDGQVVIEIAADDRELSQALKNAIENCENLGVELRRVDDLLKLDPKNVNLLTQKQELLGKSISETKEKLKLLEEEQAKFASGELPEEDYRALSREIEATKASLRNLEAESEKTQVALDGVGNASEETSEQFDRLGQSSEAVSNGAKIISAGMAAASAALVAAGSAAVSAASDFESAYAKTQTIMDQEAVSVQAMEADILSLSSASGMAAADVSEAVYQAISGSVATADAAAFVEKANKLSVAGFTSLTNATDILTTTLNAYGMSAEKVDGISNVLIRTQNLGKTSVDELSDSMGKAIATGSAYGVSLENIATGYVELTRGGIATAEATTYLSGMMNELGDSGSVVGKILMEQTGSSFGQLMADGWSLADVLRVLYDSVNNDAEALMGLWGSQEAGKAANAIITQGLKDFNTTVNTMREELDGATGTTDAAYETMTDTAEFIDKKFKNSVNNLGIAFGEQLLPGLSSVKSTLADVIDGLAGFVSEHPGVVAAIEGAAVAAGVFTIGLTAASLASGVLKKKIIELTVVMDSNPWILATSVVLGVVAAVVSLASAAEDAYPDLTELKTATEELSEVMVSSAKTYDDTVESAEAAAYVASGYIDQLEQLGSKTELTESETALYNRTLRLLVETVPELSDQIDLQNGKILTTYDALRKSTEAWKQNAIEQAKQSRYQAIYSAYADAVVKQQEAEGRLLRAQEDRKAVEERMNQLRAAAIEQADALNNSNAMHVEYTALLTDEYAELSYQLDMLCEEERVYTDAITEAGNAIDAAQEQIDELDEAFAKASDDADGMTDAQERLAEKIEEITSASETAADALQTAYNEAYTAAYESITREIGLFDNYTGALNRMAKATNKDAQSMIQSLDSQLAYMSTYAENMKKAAQMGISEGLLQQLSDGSEESAEILAGLVTMTDDQVKEMNEKFAAVSEGKQDFADAMVEYTGVVQEEKDVMVELAAQIGMDMSDMMTTELLNGLPAFYAALDRYSYGISAHARARAKQDALLGIPGYASGTDYAAQGLALVGENGPELVYFSGGERVLTAAETRAALHTVYPTAPQMTEVGAAAPAIVRGGGQQTVTIYVPLELDGREFARATAEYMGEEMAW